MLNTRLRKQIEWHFYNHKADMRLYQERRQDILDSGMTVSLSYIGSRNSPGSPTESKATKLEALDKAMDNKRDWFSVVRNTFLAFRFLPEHDIMVALYIDGKSRKRVLDDYFQSGGWERTFWRWREKWLECAYNWAKEFKLL